jgi:hypothetical protein
VQGPAGPQGPSGVVGNAFGFGQASVTTTLGFISPGVNVTVAAGQKVYVSSNAAMGALGTAATGLRLYICRAQGAVVTQVGDGSWDYTAAPNQRHSFGLSAVITGLPAGTYTVGLCGTAATPANWSNNEYGYTSALVFN